MQIGDAIVVQKQLNETIYLGALGRWFGVFIFAISMTIFYLIFNFAYRSIIAEGGCKNNERKISDGLVLALIKTAFFFFTSVMNLSYILETFASISSEYDS